MTTDDTSQSNALLFVESNQARTHGGVDHFHLANPIVARRGNRVLCQLAEAEFPVSFYTFDSNNNQLTIDVAGSNNSGSWTAPITVSIPSKNYNVVQLIAQLNALVTSSYFTFTASYDTQTLKMTFTLTSSLPGTSFAKFEVGDSTCLAQLGFVKGQTGTAGVLEATNAINLHRTLNIYVRTNMKVDNLDSLGEQKGVIAKIQVDKDVGDIVHYRNIENVKFQLTDTFLDHLKIVLLGDDGNRIDFNGLEYRLTFAFFFRKERGDFNAATLKSKVDELEELNDMAEEEAEGEEPRYTDSLVPWPVGS
jgi:hypothetical protein